VGGTRVRRSRTTYLVERYWPGVSEDLVTGAHERLAAATERSPGEGKRVRLVSSILVPKEESVFSLFEAASEDDVAEANRRAAVPFDRILQVTIVAATATERGSS
jgi:uncharacterized protein DUF4242